MPAHQVHPAASLTTPRDLERVSLVLELLDAQLQVALRTLGEFAAQHPDAARADAGPPAAGRD